MGHDAHAHGPQVDTERGPATAYVVFAEEAAAKASLAANMQEVGREMRGVLSPMCGAVLQSAVQRNQALVPGFGGLQDTACCGWHFVNLNGAGTW